MNAADERCPTCGAIPNWNLLYRKAAALRAVYRTRVGAVPVHTLALNYLDKRGQAGRPRRQDAPQTRPEAVSDLIGGVLGSMGRVA